MNIVDQPEVEAPVVELSFKERLFYIGQDLVGPEAASSVSIAISGSGENEVHIGSKSFLKAFERTFLAMDLQFSAIKLERYQREYSSVKDCHVLSSKSYVPKPEDEEEKNKWISMVTLRYGEWKLVYNANHKVRSLTVTRLDTRSKRK